MNTPIINDNSGKQIQNQAGNIRIERNLTEAALWAANETDRIFENRLILQSHTDAQGKGYDIQIQVRYDSVLGTLNTLDQRVYYCLVELWEEQRQMEIIFFSLRQLTKMLGLKWCGQKTAKTLENSLTRLRSVIIDWNGAFFDFSQKGYIHIKNPFTVLNHLLIVSTKEKVIRDKHCEFSFDKHVINNFLSNGTTPINRLVIQSLKSPTAQLLYTLLDREMYGTNEYSILTANLCQKLGLTAERWTQLGKRVKGLYACRNLILGKETGYGEVFNYYEIEPSKTKDKKLVVKRTGAKKIALVVDLAPKPKLITNPSKTPQNPSESTEKTEPIESQQEDKDPVETKKAPSEGKSQKQSPKSQQNSKNRADGKEDLPELIAPFVKKFCKSFPNADLRKIQNSTSVRSDIIAFIKEHGQEGALGFLDYAASLSEHRTHDTLKRAVMPNYLFKFKHNDEYLIDCWLESRVKNNSSNQQEIERKKEKDYEKWHIFEATHWKNYQDFIRRFFDDMSDERKQEFDALWEQQRTIQVNMVSSKENKRQINKEFDNRKINWRFLTLFKQFSEGEMPYFVEWANDNISEYKEVRQYRDTAKESRELSQLGWD